MRFVVLVALAVATATAAATATRAWGRARIIWISVSAILATACGVLVVSEVRWQNSTAAYTQLARDLTGNPSVSVSCDRLTGWQLTWSPPGRVHHTGEGELTATAHLDWPTCRSLNTWTANPTTPPDQDTVAALGVLVHEIAHLDGIRDETLATCWAIANISEAAEILGAPPPVTANLPGQLEQVVDGWPAAYRGTCPPLPT